MTTTRDLTARVLRLGAGAVAALAAAAWWAAGPPAAAGVAGGGALALLNFGWLHREVAGLARRMAAGDTAGATLRRLGLRPAGGDGTWSGVVPSTTAE